MISKGFSSYAKGSITQAYRHFPFWKVIAIAYGHAMVKDKCTR